jgi:adenine-specific DNA-methyltransferase
LLRDTKSFGLVYERHLPESVRLLTYPVKRGSKVQFRAMVNSATFRVHRVVADAATLMDSDGVEQTAPVQELVVVREFGDPVYPGLHALGRLNNGRDKPHHLVLNAENYHGVETLLFAYEEQADVLYLDPPYNSGAKDWTYNNDYVEAKDTYRHSKWLSFMEKRLVLGRRLMKPDSTMVVTIDENEVSRLGVLLEQLFPDATIRLVTIVTNPKGVTRATVSRVEEYAYFCFFGQSEAASISDDLLTPGADELPDGSDFRPRWKGLLRSGSNSKREQHPTFFYPVLIDPSTRRILGAGASPPLSESPDPADLVDGHVAVWPVRSDGTWGRWMLKPQTLKDWAEKGYVALGQEDPKRRTWGLSYLTTEPQEQIVAGGARRSAWGASL